MKEADRVLRSFVADGPTADEVVALRDRAVFSEVGSFESEAASFETSAKAASVYGSWLLVGQPTDMAHAFRHRLAQVTSEAVKAAAARYLDADRMRFVVVGDGAALKGPLAALGWGPIEMRGPDGAVVKGDASDHGGKPGVESSAKRR